MARRSSNPEQEETVAGQAMPEGEVVDEQVTTEPGAEVTITTEEGQTIAVGSALTELGEWAQTRTDEAERDNAHYMEQAVAAILAGESIDAILTPSQTINGKDAAGRPFLLHSFHLSSSGFEEGMPWYANLNVEFLDDKSRTVLNVGAPKVLAVLKKAEEFGEWPLKVMLAAKPTRAGFTVLELVKADSK